MELVIATPPSSKIGSAASDIFTKLKKRVVLSTLYNLFRKAKYKYNKR